MRNILASLLAALSFYAVSAQTGVPGEISTSFVQVRDVGDNTGPTLRPCMLWLPDSYESDQDYHPLLIFMHGHGEGGNPNGSNVGALDDIGPFKFLADETWDGSATYSTLTKKFIVFAFQMPTSTNFPPAEVDYAISQLMLRYRIDPATIIITGASGGGQSTVDYAFDLSRVNKPKHILPMSCYGTVSSTSISTLVSNGMKVWAFSPDNADPWETTTATLVSNFNSALSGSARLTDQSLGHCCWNNYYDPTYKEYFGTDQLNMYEWMIKESYDPNTGPVYFSFDAKFAGFITEAQTSLADACTTPAYIPIYTNSGSITNSIISLERYTCNPQFCLRYDGQGLHYGLTSLQGGTADQHIIINQYGQATVLESCRVLAGYISAGAYGSPGDVCSASCSTAVYSNGALTGVGDTLYTSGGSVVSGGWANYGFSTTQYGTAQRTINIDGSGVILRNDACPYTGPIARPLDFMPTDNMGNENIRIFPNPVHSRLTIQLGSNAEQITIRLYNLNGVLVYQSKASSRNHIINTGKFSKGVYMLKLHDNKNQVIELRKIIIQ